MRAALLVLLLLSCTVARVHAQSTSEQERDPLSVCSATAPSSADATQYVPWTFEVVKVAQVGDTLRAVVGDGPVSGLVPGGRGAPMSVQTVKAREANGAEADGGTILGTAQTQWIGTYEARAHVELADPDAPGRRLYAGDALRLPTTIPADAFRGTLFDLAALGIRYRGTTDSGPLYTAGEILALRSRADEAPIRARLLAEIHAAYERLVERQQAGRALPAQLLERLERGLYAGQLGLDLLGNATDADLERYLDYVETFPGKYFGTTYRIAESYAGWLVSSAPAGPRTLRDLLLDADDADTDSLILDYFSGPTEDASPDYLRVWRADAEDLGRAGQLDGAMRLLDLTERVAGLMDWEDAAASAHFQRGYILNLAGRYTASIPSYESAIAVHERLGKTESVLIALYNISANQVNLGAYADALATADRGIAYAEAARAGDPTAVSLYDLGEQVLRQGVALRFLGRYDEAFAAYERAFGLYEADGDVPSLERLAEVRRRQGDLWREQARYRRARDLYAESRDRAREVADTEGEADALDELGYVVSTLGEYEPSIALWREAARLHCLSGHLSDAGYSLSQIAQQTWTLGRKEEAIATHRAAIAVSEQANDLTRQAYSWRNLGTLYAETGQPTKALDAYDRADRLYTEAGDAAGRAELRLEQGHVFAGEHDYARAVAFYEEALQIFEEADDRAGEARTRSHLGDALFGLQRYREAEATYTKALALHRDLGDLGWQTTDLLDLATLAATGRYDRALADSLYREALTLSDDIDATSEAAHAAAAYGRFLSQVGRYDEAEAYLTDALDRWISAGNRHGEAWTRVDLGDLAQLRGDFDAARGIYEEALAIAETVNDQGRIGTVLAYLGSLATALGQFDEAEQFYRRSLAVGVEADNVWAQAGAYSGLGTLARARAQYQDALVHFARADSLLAYTGGDLATAGPRFDIGSTHLAQADYAQALAAFEETRRIYADAQFEDAGLLDVELALARTLLEQQRWTEASEANARAFALATRFGIDRVTAAALYLDGRIALDRPDGDPAAARDALHRAVLTLESTTEKPRLTQAMAALGQAHLALGALGAAERMLDRAISLADTLAMPQHVWEPSYTLALVREQQGRDADALTLLRRSVEAMETVRDRVVGGEEAQRRFAQGGPKVRVYEALVGALIEQGATEEALAYLSRSYSDDLQAQFGGFLASADAPGADLTRLREAQAEADQLLAQRALALANDRTEQAASFAAQYSVAQSEFLSLLDGDVRANPTLRDRLPDAADDFRRDHRRLPENLAVVAYLVGEERLFLFVATSDSVGAEVLRVPVDEVRGLVRDFRAAIASPTEAARVRSGSLGAADPSPDAARYAATRQRLFDLLVAPALPRLGGRSRLAIIPNGPLYDLPFAALPAPGSDGAADLDRFLTEDRTLFYVSDLSGLRPDGSADRAIRIRAFGNATTDSLAALPFAEQEVEALRQLYPDSANVFVGEAATETRVKTTPRDHTVLHLATHGVLAYPFDRSFLALAPDGTEDGRLTIDEIRRSGLGAYRLVTLSACESALGDTDVSNWPINPALSFLNIGARAVVASLWKVDDAATSAFMQTFYRRLADGDTAAALREAQTVLLANEATRHPYYWAPFVLLGDDQ